MLPRDPTEIDRLDVQHYALRAGLRGNYVAPIGRPGRILDVGSGTGQWAYDLCDEFPEAVVVGLDVEPGKPRRQANYRFVRSDVLRGLPLSGDSFAFVHQRFMRVSIPVPAWQEAVRELLRVTAPSGWVELVEFRHLMEPVGPATERIWALFHRLMRRRGLDGAGEVPRSLADYLMRAGAVDVERRVVALPVGGWGGAIGSMMATDVRAMFARLAPTFERAFEIDPDEYADLLGTVVEECEHYRSNALCQFAYGRRP